MRSSSQIHLTTIMTKYQKDLLVIQNPPQGLRSVRVPQSCLEETNLPRRHLNPNRNNMNHRQDLKSSTDVGEDARSAMGTLMMPSSTTRTLQRPEQTPINIYRLILSQSFVTSGL